MRQSTPEFEAWVEEARTQGVGGVIGRYPHSLKRSGAELVGPCPACGGRDRFAINLRKNVWHCRVSGKGGDAIALVEYLDGCDFLGAVEVLTGRPAPTGEKGKGPDARLIENRRLDAEIRSRDREREAQSFRSKEIARAHDIWTSAGPLSGSIAETYLRFRGLSAGPGAKLRSLNKLSYWHFVDKQWRVIHDGPAMVAAIQGADQCFIGCHCTWIDPDFTTKSGKAEIVHPETGELLPAKKVRGSAKGGHIQLHAIDGAERFITGEGIETVLAVRAALAHTDLSHTWFWASVSLGNLGGKARESVVHPSLTRMDAKGRVRRLKVPGPLPDFEDRDVLMPPDAANDVTILGDGDSDRFTTENVLKRAAARWARLGRTIRAAWADQGSDFNDMLRGAA